jgi:hypothetical protein
MSIEIKVKEIKLVPVDSIHPWKENVNAHPESQIENLVEQYKFNGMSSPLEVEEGSNDIVAGCGRWTAAKRAGMEFVPVYFRTYETYSHKYARMVADNAVASQAVLDLSSVHKNLENLHIPSIDLLGIADFKFEPASLAGEPETSGESIQEQLGANRIILVFSESDYTQVMEKVQVITLKNGFSSMTEMFIALVERFYADDN